MYIREKIIRKTGLTVLAVFYILFTTGCSGDDDDKKKIRLMRMVTEGMYVLCQGDKSSGAKGCISYIDPKGWSVTRVPLSGKQPRDIVLVEDYLCINYPDDNRIEFIDRKSFLSVKRIDTKDVWGEQGVGPRRLCHANQSIYVSFDAGYVGKLNDRTFSAEGIRQAGSYPEGMAFSNGLIVANSDRGRGNASIGFIEMLSFPSLNRVTSDLLICPTDILLINGGQYYLDKGTVDKDGNQIQTGVRSMRRGEIVNVMDATLFTRVNGRLFVVNAPKTVPETPVTFGYYDTDTQSSGTFDADGLENPSAMGFDEIDRRVYVACNGKDGNSGYVNIYSVEGKLVRRVETESHPIAFAVSYGSEEVE